MENLKIVSIDKLEGASNWSDWKFQVKIQLQAHGAISAVKGTPTYPNTVANDDKLECEKTRAHILKTEYIAQNLIVSSLSKEVRQLVIMCDTAKEMWDKLHGVYEQRTEQRQDRLFNLFFGVKEKDPEDNIANHIAKLEKLWCDLQDETWKEDRIKLPESLFLNRVLNTLPACYSEFINAWESVPKDQRKIGLLRERLCTVELRFQEREEKPLTGALVVSNRATSSKSSEVRSYVKTKPKNESEGRTGVVCWQCSLPGHIKFFCPQNKGKNQINNSSTSAYLGVGNHNLKNEPWVADSGATNHMTNRKDCFITWESFKNPEYVQIGNGQCLKAIGKGNINVTMILPHKQKREALDKFPKPLYIES